MPPPTPSPVPVNHSIPKGSVLGPTLFIIYLLPLGQIIHHYGLYFHGYTDDTQLYFSTSPSSQLPPQSLVNCLQAIKTWMTANLLPLNSNNTKLTCPPSSTFTGSRSSFSYNPNSFFSHTNPSMHSPLNICPTYSTNTLCPGTCSPQS